VLRHRLLGRWPIWFGILIPNYAWVYVRSRSMNFLHRIKYNYLSINTLAKNFLTYRSEALWDVENTLCLARPVAAVGCGCSRCGCSLIASAVVGPASGYASGGGMTSGRLHDLWTRSGTASSSSSSSLSTQSTWQCFGAWAPTGKPRVVDGPLAISDGAPPPHDGPEVIGLLPAPLSSTVGATWSALSSLMVY